MLSEKQAAAVSAMRRTAEEEFKQSNARLSRIENQFSQLIRDLLSDGFVDEKSAYHKQLLALHSRVRQTRANRALNMIDGAVGLERWARFDNEEDVLLPLVCGFMRAVFENENHGQVLKLENGYTVIELSHSTYRHLADGRFVFHDYPGANAKARAEALAKEHNSEVSAEIDDIDPNAPVTMYIVKTALLRE